MENSMDRDLRTRAVILVKELHILWDYVCICGEGNVLSRNPYWHSKKTKQCLAAIYASIDRSIEAILLFTAAYVKLKNSEIRLQAYYETYQFLFDFHDDIKKYEYEHRILIRDQDMLAKFKKLLYQSEYLLADL